MSEARKSDAHEKITLGGLIVKAGLREADKGFLLGLLIYGSSLSPLSEEYRRLRTLGDTKFAGTDHE